SSTDFWGISWEFSAIDQQDLPSDELERELALLRACWSFFDDIRAGVSAELRPGARGGGRDRQRIVLHVLHSEQEFARKVGVPMPDDETALSVAGRAAHRDAYCAAIRACHAQDKTARGWPLRYLIRHTAYHTLDHTWEMEDRDLTAP